MFKHKFPNIPFYILSFFVLISLVCTSLFSGSFVEPVAAQSCPPDLIERFGVNVAREGGTVDEYPVDQLNLGWYMDYGYRNTPDAPAALPFVRMIRTRFDTANLDSAIGPIVDANPGTTWLAGNEPDRNGQDGITAEEYAVFYHDVYTFLKDRDPTAQVAFAGLVMPTRLRQKYLDRVLAEYNRLYGQNPPADIVHVHGFVMSEKLIVGDGEYVWGAGVPPGMSATDPLIQYVAPQNHWDINILRNNLISFRQWMANNGYRNKPLIVSEYGILLPDGWDLNSVGTANFMTSTFDLFLDQTNGTTGYPADGNRLVQQFAWFSLNFPDDTAQGALNGSLFTPFTTALTSLGQAYRNYTNNKIQTCGIPPTPVPPTPTPTPPPGVLGDVNCDDVSAPVDALFILQHAVGLRADSGGCPLPDINSLHAALGDVNGDDQTSPVDALFVLQCSVGINNVFCPAVEAAQVMDVEAATAAVEAKILLIEAGLWPQQDNDVFVPLITR